MAMDEDWTGADWSLLSEESLARDWLRPEEDVWDDLLAEPQA